jgi:hypothetical protein
MTIAQERADWSRKQQASRRISVVSVRRAIGEGLRLPRSANPERDALIVAPTSRELALGHSTSVAERR